eukprot:symbB.v1.2.032158.t1/scaffold3821.1/size49711/2
MLQKGWVAPKNIAEGHINLISIVLTELDSHISIASLRKTDRPRKSNHALLASTAAHFRLREPKLLVRLGQSVGSNLDAFTLQQVGMVAEAFAVVGHHHRSLVGYIEQILLKESDFEGRSRPKLLATFLIAAAQQEHFAQRSQHLERFSEELTAALESYEVPMELSRLVGSV